MSVIDTIDTTVTVEWSGQRTIGTLVELNGQSAVLTALRLPEIGEDIAFRVEGETEEEAVTLDGICVGVDDTGWGERRAEVDLLRVGTTCSASRLRDFIESWSITRGGSVHIGQSREQPTVKRFVYHVPDGGVRAMPDMRQTIESALPATTDDLDLPSQVIDRNAVAALRKRDGTSTSPGQGRRPPRETVPASNWVVGGDEVGFEEEFAVATNPERTLNSDVAAGFLAGGGLDAAFREALRAVEQPRMPSRPSLPNLGTNVPPPSLFDTGPTLLDDEEDELEPTRMMSAISDDDGEAAMPVVAFETGELSNDQVSQLMAKVDDAIELERSIVDSESFDMDEPIIVNTVGLEVPFADPVQLGTDNRAPTMAQATAAPEPGPTLELDLPTPVSAEKPKRQRRMTVAETLSLPLKAPTPIEVTDEPEDDDGHGEEDPIEAAVLRPQTREPSEALKRIAEVFAVDIAVRCDLQVQLQIGRKKYNGVVLRLAESKLRVASPAEPQLYQRLQVLFPDPTGGKKPFVIPAEVVRIREREGDENPVSYDMRISPGTSPKEMNLLRALIKTFQAPGT